MNNNFRWNRFEKVICKDFTDMWRSFGTTMIVLVILPVAVWLLRLALSTNAVAPAESRYQGVQFLVLLGSVMSVSRIYRNCNLTNKGIGFAMLPASKEEKFASMARAIDAV